MYSVSQEGQFTESYHSASVVGKAWFGFIPETVSILAADAVCHDARLRSAAKEIVMLRLAWEECKRRGVVGLLECL